MPFLHAKVYGGSKAPTLFSMFAGYTPLWVTDGPKAQGKLVVGGKSALTYQGRAYDDAQLPSVALSCSPANGLRWNTAPVKKNNEDWPVNYDRGNNPTVKAKGRNWLSFNTYSGATGVVVGNCIAQRWDCPALADYPVNPLTKAYTFLYVMLLSEYQVLSCQSINRTWGTRDAGSFWYGDIGLRTNLNASNYNGITVSESQHGVVFHSAKNMTNASSRGDLVLATIRNPPYDEVGNQPETMMLFGFRSPANSVSTSDSFYMIEGGNTINTVATGTGTLGSGVYNVPTAPIIAIGPGMGNVFYNQITPVQFNARWGMTAAVEGYMSDADIKKLWAAYQKGLTL